MELWLRVTFYRGKYGSFFAQYFSVVLSIFLGRKCKSEKSIFSLVFPFLQLQSKLVLRLFWQRKYNGDQNSWSPKWDTGHLTKHKRVNQSGCFPSPHLERPTGSKVKVTLAWFKSLCMSLFTSSCFICLPSCFLHVPWDQPSFHTVMPN